MEYLIDFIIYFFIVFFIYKLYFIFFTKRKNFKIKNMIEIVFLEKSFKIKIEDYKPKKLYNTITLANSFLFSLILTATLWIDTMVFRILAIFLLLLPLTYLMYFIMGKHLQKRGKKNV